MIHTTRPVAANPKCERISGGRMRSPAARPSRSPPRPIQMLSRMKPPPAVSTHAINAAHSIAPPSQTPPFGLVPYRTSATRASVAVRSLVAPDAPHRKAGQREHEQERERVGPRGRPTRPEERREIDHDERRAAVEDDLLPLAPALDLAAQPVAPDEEDEERHGEEEGDPHQDPERDDEERAKRRMESVPESAHVSGRSGTRALRGRPPAA